MEPEATAARVTVTNNVWTVTHLWFKTNQGGVTFITLDPRLLPGLSLWPFSDEVRNLPLQLHRWKPEISVDHQRFRDGRYPRRHESGGANRRTGPSGAGRANQTPTPSGRALPGVHLHE